LTHARLAAFSAKEAQVQFDPEAMPKDLVYFDQYELDPGSRELRRDGAVVPLQRIPLELLFLLVERRGGLVTRDEIIERVWGKGVFVDSESAINTAVRKVRRALRDSAEAPRFIATVPARGYRFIADLREPRRHGRRPVRTRGTGTLVGRERELATLLAGLDDAASSRGRLFLISGEAGVGKSRLTDEVGSEADARGMTLLVGHSSEQDEAVAYLPFVEVLENFIDRARDVDRVRTAFGEQAPELARLLPGVNSLLPGLPPPLQLSPPQARRHLFNSYFYFLSRAAAEQATLMILEDLHWADDSTLSLLDHLVPRVSELPLMLICTYRDDAVDQAPGFARTLEFVMRRQNATRLALKCLPREEVAEMIHGLSGKPPPAAIVGEIFAETEGNPFFVEELFRHLEEENRLYDSSGQFRSELRIGDHEAPQSVRLVIGRRLARLSDAAQRMLAVAATIGRVFDFDLLRAACDVEADPLLERLDEAERTGLIASAPASATLRYAFSHELIRQTVVAGLSAARRQRLNLDVAAAIERSSGGAADSGRARGLESRANDLANRYARGGDPLKAAQYYARAVRSLAYVGSNAEALSQFESGLELLHLLPEGDQRSRIELDLRLAVTGALGDRKGYASLEAERSLVRAMELGRREGVYWKKTWLALYGVLFIYLTRPDVPKACEMAAELLALAEKQDSIDHVADANTYLAYARMYAGEFQEADRLLEHGWSLLESIVEPGHGLPPQLVGQMLQTRDLLWEEGTPQNNCGLSGLNLWFLGYPDRATERIAIATEIAQSGIKTMLADVHGFATYFFDLLREPDRMRERAEARRLLSNESGYVTGRALSEFYLGYADALGGDLESGLARMQQHLADLRAMNFQVGASYYLALVAAVLGRMERFDESLCAIDQSFPMIERTGQRHYAAEVHRIKGELLLAQDRSNAARAEDSLRTARDIARRQRARSFELRAATSLARLLRDTDRREEARAMLGEIYNWFTEGFDTADLKDAKALLDELGG
jgi:DNA-binding winged helix-turn-helix (wHTH) protein